METFLCSSCHCQLTHDEYFICVNRTCQTAVSALTDQKVCETIDSSTVCSVSHSTLARRTVSIQVDTLTALSPDQRTWLMAEENDDESSSSSFNSNWPRTSSSDSSFVSCTTSDSDQQQHHSGSWIARHLKYGFNSNQPMKSSRLSEEENESQRVSPVPRKRRGDFVCSSRRP